MIYTYSVYRERGNEIERVSERDRYSEIESDREMGEGENKKKEIHRLSNSQSMEHFPPAHVSNLGSFCLSQFSR